MTKRNKVIIVTSSMLALILLALAYLWFANIYRLNNKTISGQVKKRDNGYWGLETTFSRHKLSIKNLPTEFRKENIKINCKISIADVIGTNDWDVYVEVSDCKR